MFRRSRGPFKSPLPRGLRKGTRAKEQDARAPLAYDARRLTVHCETTDISRAENETASVRCRTAECPEVGPGIPAGQS